jgi:hypothetical protein
MVALAQLGPAIIATVTILIIVGVVCGQHANIYFAAVIGSCRVQLARAHGIYQHIFPSLIENPVIFP